jgi:hypothetical protein
LPDLIHVNFLPAEVEVIPVFEQRAPALGAAARLIEELAEAKNRHKAITRALRRI